MGNTISVQSSVALGTGVVAGAVTGYALRICTNKSSVNRPSAWKSFENKDPVTEYITNHSLRLLPVQEKLKKETLQHPLGLMMGAPEICQLLQNLIRAINAKRVIEIGVFTGFSTLGFALALPDDGQVIACDVSEEFMNIGKSYWKEAGVEHKIDIKIQPAEKTLDEFLERGKAGSFDLVFIDADKPGYDVYYEKSLQLIRKGGIIALDNVLWSGSVLDEFSTRPGASHMRKLNDKLRNDNRIEITMLNIGDGLTLAFKK